MPRSIPPPSAPLAGVGQVPRRAVVGLGLGLAASVLPACGPVRIGQPAPYTPPPMGIDDLYRADLLEGIDALLAVTATDVGSPEAVAAVLRSLHAALLAHREALLTGAEAEKERSAGPSTTAPPAAAGAAELPALLEGLGSQVMLGAEACVQCSGSFARVVAAISAHLTWAAARLAHVSADPRLTAPSAPTVDTIRPSREVPTSDPPSVAAAVDYESTLRRAQGDEWYAGYVQEVRAARATDAAVRAPLLAASDAHRDRARMLDAWAAEDDVASEAEQPVYPLPGGGLDPRALASAPERIGTSLMTDWVALTGAAPFERRAPAVAVALAEAHALGALTSSIPELPSLEAQDG